MSGARVHPVVVGLGICMMVGLGGPAHADHIAPIGNGARKYFAPPATGPGNEAFSDPLARALGELVARAAAAAGHVAPRPDVRLTAVAETLAEHLGPDEVPGLELQEFLLSHFGLGDPLPEMGMFQVGLSDEIIRSKFAGRIPAMMRGGPYGRVGVGVVRRGWFGKTSVVLALQRTDIELLPVPRRMAVGDSALIAGRLLRGRRDPRVLVAPPRGEVETIVPRGQADSFQASFRCASAGRYQVEIMATGFDGKTVVANFPVFCGVEPPTTIPKSGVGSPETTDVARAEALALEAVNRDRTALGLPSLVRDEPLARAARSYADELARRQVVEHVSRESGDASDRIRRAGAKAFIVYENVGRANSIADVQRSFMSSPGHRANVLARQVTRAGIGVAIRQEKGMLPTFYVTQLFAK